MTETENDEISMAECGNCRAIIASDSSECSECKIKFSGLSEDALGECGACGTLVPLESTSCSSCGVAFVADDVMDVLRNWLSNTGLSIAALFDKFDTNGDGMIDSDELRQGLLSLNLADLPPSQVDRLIEQIDLNGDGKIDLGELEKSVTGAEYSPSVDEKEVEEEERSEVETGENGDVEETEEEVDDDSDDSEEEVDDDSDDSEEEVDDDDSEESIVEFELVQHKPDDILELLISIMDEQEANPADIFHVLDEDGDKFISSEEFSNTVGELLENEDISESSIADFIASLDTDKDGNIDIIEFISAIETKEGDSEKPPKEFPSPMQSAVITKKWNDVWWPLIHAAFFAFILIWVVNGLGLIVDGSGGSVALETSYGMGSGDLSEGDIYPCDKDIQVDKCANSLTPFSGDSSSMPKGFYADGIFFMLLGAMGMVGSMFTHLVLAKGWRARVKAMKEVESDTEDAKEASDDEDEGDSNLNEAMMNLCKAIISNEMTIREAFESIDTDGNGRINGPELQAGLKTLAGDELSAPEVVAIIETLDEDGDGTLDPMELVNALESLDMDLTIDHPAEQSDDDDDDDDDIDVGSHIGLTVDEEEYFGTIIEFDDEDELVTIKEDGTGDEITGYQDEMFLE